MEDAVVAKTDVEVELRSSLGDGGKVHVGLW